MVPRAAPRLAVRITLLTALFAPLAGGPVHAQSRVSCEASARDYANMVAPRSGAPAIAGTSQGLPNPIAGEAPRRRAMNDQERMGGGLAAHQNAYAAALARCRARGG